MKKAILLVLAVAAVIFIGNPAVFKTVTFHETFKGQGAEWKGEMLKTGSLVFYRYDGVLSCDNNVDCDITLTYTGNQKELIAQKYYSFTCGDGQSTRKTDEPIPVKKIYHTKDRSIPAYSDSNFNITVDIDGKTDSFELKKVN